ncbi:hypothetical protein [Hymenobacter sp. UYCo722]|uniref:hypothetical protein n=1 Tax=Hymenobacter sp. UYCo722 TaxID=3156335 RepID=UPI0033972406
MKSTNRVCIQCGEPFIGRADKKTCSDACRAQHRRDALAESENWTQEEEPEVYLQNEPRSSTPYTMAIPQRHVPEYVERQDTLADVFARLAREREIEAVEKENGKLDQRFCKFVNECLKADKMPFNDEDDDELQTWLDEVDELIVDYRAHSGLRVSNELTNGRLDDLHWLSDKFRRMLVKWQKQPTSWLSANEPVYLDISDKRRLHLREHLLKR